MKNTVEHQRLQSYRDKRSNWKHWGPYLSERAWGTVREDYSEEGEPWQYFSHEQARSRAYRWNEDGLAGISDRNQYLCFALALWNGNDPILKERLYGLTGPEGNHGEDVKEVYYYLDSTPTHSYMKMLYKYPQHAFPYAELLKENQQRGYADFEYELLDTGSFDDNRYFDVEIEYAKASEDDLLIRVHVFNRGPERATCHIMPTLWFRNTWSWGYASGPMHDVEGKPEMTAGKPAEQQQTIRTWHPTLGEYQLYAAGIPELLFTENETNRAALFGTPNASSYVKDAFHRYLIDGETAAVNQQQRGTKAAVHYSREIDAGACATIRLRLSNVTHHKPFGDFDAIFAARQEEADDFFDAVQNPLLDAENRRIQRQGIGGDALVQTALLL